jgi:hypothetical protein
MVMLWVSLAVVAAVWVGVYCWLEWRDRRSLRRYLAQKHATVTWQSSTAPADLDDTTPSAFDDLQREARGRSGR